MNGVGKTIEAIATFDEWRKQVLKETGMWLPILIVTPRGTFESWQEKLAEWAPHLTVHTIVRNKTGQDLFIYHLGQLTYDVYIINYQSLRVITPRIKDFMVFSIICADECHAIANHKAQQSIALKSIKTYRKLAMSGTASGSKPANLWSVLNWLYPTYYTSYWRFVRQYCVTDGGTIGPKNQNSSYIKIVGVKNTDLLHSEIGPFYIRHNKSTYCCPNHPRGVMSELPDKIYEKITVDLNAQQRRIYNEMHSNMVAWVGEQNETPFIASIAAVKLMRLMQTTLATPHVTWDDEGRQTVDLTDPSPKIDTVLELVTDEPEKSFIVYTNSKKAANLCGARLKNAGVSTLVLTGDTPDKERDFFTANFRARKIRVVVAVIRTAEGFDGLQEVCDTMIFMNRDLSAFKNQQAEDRLHRGGQKNPVTIIDIVASKTLDAERLDIDKSNWKVLLELLDKKYD